MDRCELVCEIGRVETALKNTSAILFIFYFAIQVPAKSKVYVFYIVLAENPHKGR